MKRFFVSLFLLIGLLGGGSFAFAQPASAFNPLDTACKSGANDSTACDKGTQNTPITGPNGIIVRVTRLVAVFAGVIAVIMIIVYGIMMIASYGDSGKVTTARNGIIAAFIGLIVIFLSQTIVVFVISNI